MITAYVANGCPHCERLLIDLRRRRVSHTCVNLSEQPERAAEVEALTWDRRLPVTVDHERISVGFAGGSSSFAELGVGGSPSVSASGAEGGARKRGR